MGVSGQFFRRRRRRRRHREHKSADPGNESADRSETIFVLGRGSSDGEEERPATSSAERG